MSNFKMLKYFKIGLDIGYGWVKGVNERGERVLIRSLVAPPYSRDLNDAFGVENQDTDIHVVVTMPDGSKKEIFVGELALSSTKAAYAFDKNKIDHPTTTQLIATATSMLTVGVDQPLHLITGLPLDFYKTQKVQFENYLREFKGKVQHKAGKFEGTEYTIGFEKATVYLQGGASIYSCLMNIHGVPTRKDLLQQGLKLAVINMGFYTLDVIVFEAGEKFKPLGDMSFSSDEGVGMVEIRKIVEQAFYEQSGARLNLPQVEPILKSGGINYKGKYFDLKNDIKRAKDIVAQINLDTIKTKWGSQKDFIHTAFICGGGPGDLEERILGFHHNQEIVEDHQFADALGYLIYGRLQEYKENREREKQLYTSN
ncbi:ParM/StbA family protein [Acinetobacter sp. CUI P1]|nr:ParM/StbA family protein [Acinetobacter sp. CUI P1]